MTLGEKIKEVRKQAGLSQEQLSEKLHISRSAVAKWETNNGIPDVDNLKAISTLLNVSVDYLLDNNENVNKAIIKESINLSLYKGSRRTKKDKCVRAKYPTAKINPLLIKISLTKEQRLFDNLLGLVADAPFGTAEVFKGLKDIDKQYYLVEQDGKQFLVLVTNEFILSRTLLEKQDANKFEIDDTIFTKCTYEVK